MSDYDKNDKEIYEYTKQSFNDLKATNSNLAFVIARSKNKNMVVYEFKMDGDKLAAVPLEVYWLDIDPEYQAAARKKGKADDRVDLNMIENSMAYGFSTSANEDGTFNANLVALPSGKKATIKVVNGVVGIYLLINGQEARVLSVFAKSVERTFLPPKCLYVDIYGVLEDGTEVVERINV